MHYGEVRVLGKSDVMKGISVAGIFVFKEANCQLVIGLVTVWESCEVCVTNVTVEESNERLRDGRTSCCVREQAGVTRGAPAWSHEDNACIRRSEWP